MPARLDSARTANHALRSHLLAMVHRDPGATVAALNADLAATTMDHPARATLEYHLRRLEEHGLVRSGLAAGARRYYPAGGPWSYDPVAYALAVTTASSLVARNILERPGITSADLAWTLHRGASWRPERTLEALRRLAAAGLITLRVQGRARFCHPEPKLAAMLAVPQSRPAPAPQAVVAQESPSPSSP